MEEQVLNTTRFGDPIESPSIGFSFDAPGWQLVFVLLALLAIAFVLYRLYKYNKNKYRRDAIKAITTLQAENPTSSELVQFVNGLVKRILLRDSERTAFAHLTGERWFEYLSARCAKVSFDASDATLLRESWDADKELDLGSVKAHTAKMKKWIQHYKTN